MESEMEETKKGSIGYCNIRKLITLWSCDDDVTGKESDSLSVPKALASTEHAAAAMTWFLKAGWLL